MESSFKRIGIVGYGKFGQLLAQMLRAAQPDLELVVVDSNHDQGQPLSAVVGCELILLAVPIAALEGLIVDLTDIFAQWPEQQAIIVDVCSVKEYPAELLLRLPAQLQLIASHPNFGPESFRLNSNSSAGLNWICYPLRIPANDYQKFLALLDQFGVQLTELSPADHDRLVGVPHFTSMLIGQLLATSDMKRIEIGAASTQKMFDMIEGVGQDFAILKAMYEHNQQVPEWLATLQSKLAEIKTQLEE